MNKYRLFVWMVVLSSLAGYVNAITVFGYTGVTVSHVTGLLSKFAIAVAGGDFRDCGYAAAVIASFFAGTVVAGIATGERAFYLHKVYGFIILAIGALVLVPPFLPPWYNLMLLAFLMGLQNGMVVSFRGIVVRLTHMTGNLTDLGVHIGYKIRGNRKEKAIFGLIPAATLAGFTVGGIVGAWSYHVIGVHAFAVVSAVYLLLGSVYFYLQKTCRDKDFNGVPDDREAVSCDWGR